MAKLYDSGKVREAAASVRVLSGALKEGTDRADRGARMSAEPLKGKASEAMSEKLATTVQGIGSICAALNEIGRALEEYAEALEAVDDRLSAEM